MFQTFSLDCLTLEDGTDRLYRKSININLSYVTPRRANILERFYGSQAPWPQGKKCVWYIKAVLCLYMDDRNYEPVSYLLNQGTKLTTGQLVKKKKSAFCGTRRITITFTRVHHWSISWNRRIPVANLQNRSGNYCALCFVRLTSNPIFTIPYTCKYMGRCFRVTPFA